MKEYRVSEGFIDGENEYIFTSTTCSEEGLHDLVIGNFRPYILTKKRQDQTAANEGFLVFHRDDELMPYCICGRTVDLRFREKGLDDALRRLVVSMNPSYICGLPDIPNFLSVDDREWSALKNGSFYQKSMIFPGGADFETHSAFRAYLERINFPSSQITNR